MVNDPYEQKIAIDKFNRVHIIDREKLETGYKLVHYQKINDLWQGYIIDEADFFIVLYSLIKSEQKLYIAYYRSDEEGEGDIYLASYDIITGSNEPEKHGIVNKLDIYPNPFKTQTTIEFTTAFEQQTDVSIYNLNGKHIKTLMNKNTTPGKYQLIWNGKAENGKEVTKGIYLVRLQSGPSVEGRAGRKIVTKAVEYVK